MLFRVGAGGKFKRFTPIPSSSSSPTRVIIISCRRLMYRLLFRRRKKGGPFRRTASSRSENLINATNKHVRNAVKGEGGGGKENTRLINLRRRITERDVAEVQSNLEIFERFHKILRLKLKRGAIGRCWSASINPGHRFFTRPPRVTGRTKRGPIAIASAAVRREHRRPVWDFNQKLVRHATSPMIRRV